jgi:hypothetical protein
MINGTLKNKEVVLQKSYDSLFGMMISKDGNSWLTRAWIRDQCYLISSGGEELGPFEKSETYAISFDGSAWVAGIKVKGDYYIITNSGNRFGPFYTVVKVTMTSNRNFWIAHIEERKQKAYIINSAGDKFGPFDTILDMLTSSDGEFWIAKVGVPKETRWGSGIEYYLTTSKEDYYGPFHLGAVVGSLGLSADGKSWVADVGGEDFRSYIINNKNKKYGPYFSTSFLSFSADGNTWICGALIDEKFYIVSNKEKPIGRYNRVGFTSISSDGNAWIADVEKEDGAYIVTNERKEIGPYYAIFNPIISSDGSLWAAGICKRNKAFLITSKGREYGPYLDLDPGLPNWKSMDFCINDKNEINVLYTVNRGGKNIIKIDTITSRPNP